MQGYKVLSWSELEKKKKKKKRLYILYYSYEDIIINYSFYEENNNNKKNSRLNKFWASKTRLLGKMSFSRVSPENSSMLISLVWICCNVNP